MTRLVIDCERCLRDITIWSGQHFEAYDPMPPSAVEVVLRPPSRCPWCGWDYSYPFPWRGHRKYPSIRFQNLPIGLRPYDEVTA